MVHCNEYSQNKYTTSIKAQKAKWKTRYIIFALTNCITQLCGDPYCPHRTTALERDTVLLHFTMQTLRTPCQVGLVLPHCWVKVPNRSMSHWNECTPHRFSEEGYERSFFLVLCCTMLQQGWTELRSQLEHLMSTSVYYFSSADLAYVLINITLHSFSPPLSKNPLCSCH